MDMLGATVDPIFTPPWNRCSQTTADLLYSMPFKALSRDHTAATLQLSELVEIPVSVDWCRWEKADSGRERLGQQIATGIAAGDPVGVMLHHAAMSGDACDAVGDLLDLLMQHGQVRCVSMMSLLAPNDRSEASA